MGHAKMTVLNLSIHSADAEKGLLLIKGPVPGPRGGTVLVRSAVKEA
jgi:large subunit ribosomal protein L3